VALDRAVQVFPGRMASTTVETLKQLENPQVLQAWLIRRNKWISAWCGVGAGRAGISRR
jgi:hypothetical protein